MSPHADQSGLSPAPAAVAEGQGGAADATASATGEALTQARAALDEGCRLALVDVAKDFVMHLRGGQRISVVEAVTFSARPSACVVLAGPSGAGKSSILKMIYANYRCARGVILVRDAVSGAAIDVARASPRDILRLRARTVGYVSQFLRVIPRVGALALVEAAAMPVGQASTSARETQHAQLDFKSDLKPGSETPRERARARARDLLTRLNVPEALWDLPPATFSGGEQQRVNVAIGLAATRPLLLVDEPTASLDARNRDVVVELINEQRAAGTTIIGIFHDGAVRDAVATDVIDVSGFKPRNDTP